MICKNAIFWHCQSSLMSYDWKGEGPNCHSNRSDFFRSEPLAGLGAVEF